MEDQSPRDFENPDQPADSDPSIEAIIAAFQENLRQQRGQSEPNRTGPSAGDSGGSSFREALGSQSRSSSNFSPSSRGDELRETIAAFREARGQRRNAEGGADTPGTEARSPISGAFSPSGEKTGPEVLSVCSHKGGTGKTTTAIHIAAALGRSGRRVLVLDLDPQGFLTRAVGVEEPPVDESVAAFFDPEIDFRTPGIRNVSGFDLVPSSNTLTTRMRELNEPTDVLWIQEALRSLDPKRYDLILLDTAAAVTVYSLNALVASQHALIPVLPEYQSIVGCEQTRQTTRLVEEKLNPLLESRIFLLTQVDGRKGTHQTYQEYVRKRYGSAVLNTVIRTNAALADSQEEGTTVFEYSPGSRGAQDYARAAEEIAARIWDAPSREAEGALGEGPNDRSGGSHVPTRENSR